jgi:fibronectin type 3 domain-containing protein
MRLTGGLFRARALRRGAMAALLVAFIFPATGCMISPTFSACLASGTISAEACLEDADHPGEPAAPSGPVATYVVEDDASAVVLDWSDSPEPDLALYNVYRAPTRDGPFTFHTISFQSEWRDDCHFVGNCGVCTKFYVVTAEDLAGLESAPSAVASAQINCPAPADLRAVAYDGRVGLAWSPNIQEDVAGYNVYRSLHEAGPSTELSTDAIVAEAVYEDREVRNGTKYFYRVTAVSLGGHESEPSAVAAATPNPDETDVPPAAPTGVTLRPGNHIVRIDWDDNTEPDLAGYDVFRTNENHGPVRLNEDRLTASEFVIEELPNGVEVELWVLAVDLAGNFSAPQFYYATPHPGDPPIAPTGLTAEGGDGRVDLDWDDNHAPDLEGYNVYVADEGDGTYTKVNARLVTSSAYAHTGVANGSPLYYRVTAVDLDRNESDPSAIASATPQAADEAPAAPTGLTVTPGLFSATLDWADNTEADLAGYTVYLSFYPDGPFNAVGRGLVTVSQSTVNDLPTTVPTYFRLTAVDTAGHESLPSVVVSTTACPVACGTPSLSRLAAGRTETAAHAGSSAFKLLVSGAFSGGGRVRLDGGSYTGSGLGFSGSFRLKPSLQGVDDRELRRLATAGLVGSWRSRIDWRLTPAAGTGTTTGIALARFANPQVGESCLRFTESYTVSGRAKKARVLAQGSFTLLGATSKAATLLGGGSYVVEIRADGSLRYRGKATRAAGAAPLPAECVALEAP